MATSTASSGVLILLLALLALCVLAIAVVPAYILWRATKDKRVPMLWMGCTLIIVVIAATLNHFQRPNVPAPTPVSESLSDVADKTGTLTVTALRIPNPAARPARVEIDLENAGAEQVYLGLQLNADSGSLGSFSPGRMANVHIWTVPPKWKGTLTHDVTLPGFVFGGRITVVLARCATPESTDPLWLPRDSEALYQEHFTVVPPLETGQSQ
ncbi:MAG TPA: hypothetical protein PK869_01840 [Candidatus Hydrogenedentes bacterium]|nr:hypothetical protein [Candidatus Hydrogenedentota bacterium]